MKCQSTRFWTFEVKDDMLLVFPVRHPGLSGLDHV